METYFYVKYVGSLKHWKDAIFKVPLVNIMRKPGSAATQYPLIGESVTVKKESKSGRARKWNGVVVSELDVFDERKLLQLNNLEDDVSSNPPGSVIDNDSSAPLAKRA